MFETLSWKKVLRIILKIVFYVSSGYYAIPFFFRISFGLYQNFISSSVSFNLDTIYINWNTSFPAVTVCEIYNGEKIWDISEDYFEGDHDLRLDDFVGEIVFYRGTCTTCDTCDEIPCPENFTQLIETFRSKCTDLIGNCTYINHDFDCCDEFLPIHTEYGQCFAFNSNQARKILQVQYSNNRATGAGHLQFYAHTDIQLHVHPPIEIPFPFSEGMIRETVLQGSLKEIIINVMDIYNHVTVERKTYEERRCRFGHELTDWGRELGLYAFYSYSTCVVECILQIQIEHCNCTNHFLSAGVTDQSKAPMCNYNGLRCITDHYYDMLEERKACDCMSSCEEPEYDIVYNSADEYSDGETSSDSTQIHVGLIELPTQRYVRLVAKNFLDFMISVGGIAGLFFNASIIRAVEVVFLIVRFNWRGIRLRS